MKYDLFVTDYDGTLGGLDGIHEETVRAIREYEKRGGKFVICTGRMFGNIRVVCERYDIADVVVSYQGARINERKSGNTIFADKIDNALAASVLTAIKDLPVKPAVLSTEKLYYTENSVYTKWCKKTNAVDSVCVPDLAKCVAEHKFDALKINIICEGVNISEFIKEYGERYKNKLIVNSSGPILAEFINPAANKGASVRFLSKYYGIGYDKIIAVGDSTNDLELINGPWHGVAVGDGREELKQVADEITVPFADQPVKHLLEKYCL